MALSDILKKNAEKNAQNGRNGETAADANANAERQIRDATTHDVKDAPRLISEDVVHPQDIQPKLGSREEQYIYSCPNAHQFKIGLIDGPVKAKNGVLTVNAAQHKEIQDLIHKHQRFDISQNAILLDPEAARKVAEEHMKAHPRRPDAARGATSSAGTVAHMQNLEGHMVPDALSGMQVVELDAQHAEDSTLDPERH